MGFQCRKPANPNRTDIPGLPPATQTGANTLGFLLNGQPWTPQGSNGTANLSIDFDSGIKNGYFSIAAYSFTGSRVSQLIIGIRDSINFIVPPQSYKIGRTNLGASIFTDSNFCERRSDEITVSSNGFIKVEKLDGANRILAGTFSIILYNPLCGDTIKITQGRFDLKF